MGVLAQAKNGDEQFWNIEISSNQWEGSACTQSALIFFLLSFGCFGEVGRSEDFFHFSFVPNMFPSSSWVPNVFLNSPRVFPIAPHFNPICFAQGPPLLTYIPRPKGIGIPSFHRIFYFGESP
jgi:hypothetical protein